MRACWFNYKTCFDFKRLVLLDAMAGFGTPVAVDTREKRVTYSLRIDGRNHKTEEKEVTAWRDLV